MCVDEMISPSSSTSRETRVANASWACSSAASPRARWPKRKFSPTDTRSAPSWSTSTRSTNSCGDWAANDPSKGITTSSETPSSAISVGLRGERGQELGRRVRSDDRARVRLEGEHGVGAADDLAVAEVDTVELADREIARPPFGVGEPGDVSASLAAEAYDGLEQAVRTGLGERDQAGVVAQPHRGARRCLPRPRRGPPSWRPRPPGRPPAGTRARRRGRRAARGRRRRRRTHR